MSDLGDPRRVVNVLSSKGIENEWATLWQRDTVAVAEAC